MITGSVTRKMAMHLIATVTEAGEGERRHRVVTALRRGVLSA
jgi:hypothetical protein